MHLEIEDNYMARAFAPAEARHYEVVQQETWGHLAPEPRRAYPGVVLFTHTAWGDRTLIQATFDSLEDSPWFHEDLMEFIESVNTEPGRLYQFTGTYMRFKNGRCRFSGQTAGVFVDARRTHLPRRARSARL